MVSGLQEKRKATKLIQKGEQRQKDREKRSKEVGEPEQKCSEQKINSGKQPPPNQFKKGIKSQKGTRTLFNETKSHPSFIFVSRLDLIRFLFKGCLCF